MVLYFNLLDDQGHTGGIRTAAGNAPVWRCGQYTQKNLCCRTTTYAASGDRAAFGMFLVTINGCGWLPFHIDSRLLSRFALQLTLALRQQPVNV
jgi:hypothetical protein